VTYKIIRSPVREVLSSEIMLHRSASSIGLRGLYEATSRYKLVVSGLFAALSRNSFAF
jgi:hypothetical protein